MTTLRDQRAINVTIYNDGNALVHDERTVPLQTGLNRIAWRDVSASMDPTSALLDAAQSGAGISVLEQNFNYDVLNGDSLLHKYLGHWVTVVHPPKFAGERARRERAKILSLDNGIVLQYADRVETQLNGYIDFPSIPSSLRDRPTLTLDVVSQRGGRQNLDLRYLTTGMSWNVNYVATLSPDQRTMALTGLVTLENASGTSYHNARLQLVAGTIHQVAPAALKTIAVVRPGTTADTYSTNAVQQGLFDYHLYTFTHPTTILDKQTKQLALLSVQNVPVRKSLEVVGAQSYYQARPDVGDRLPVRIFVSFENKQPQLGMPLPAGVIRVYQDDTSGLAQYLGSDGIGHTPRNDAVRLNLGDAFDVVAQTRQTAFSLISNCESRASYRVHLTNGGDGARAVSVVEPMPADWRIQAESQPHVKSSSATATWAMQVPGNGSADLTYTADVRWCVKTR